jgi:hypothetical protein
MKKILEPAMVCFNGDPFHIECDFPFGVGIEIDFKVLLAPSDWVEIIGSV